MSGRKRIVVGVAGGIAAYKACTVVRQLAEAGHSVRVIPTESALKFVGAATRAPRPGEVDGVDYSFVTPDRFDRLIAEGALLEWAEIHGGLHRSGTPAEPVREAAAAGRPVLIEVDLAGARAVKQTMAEATTVFLAPPDWASLEARLIGRGTETPEAIARRLQTAREELAAQGDFDVVVVNSRLESACAELVSLLMAHSSSPRDHR